MEVEGIRVHMSGHAYEHYEASKHIYCQNLLTQEVWDFSKEDYVDRLIQNQVDGKLIEFARDSRPQQTNAND